jgi:hypothetical protein
LLPKTGIGDAENLVNAGLIVVMEPDGATTLLLMSVPQVQIVVKMMNVSETVNGTDHLLP